MFKEKVNFMKKRVTTIFGARPQFIKASVLSREIQNYE